MEPGSTVRARNGKAAEVIPAARGRRPRGDEVALRGGLTLALTLTLTLTLGLARCYWASIPYPRSLRWRVLRSIPSDAAAFVILPSISRNTCSM